MSKIQINFRIERTTLEKLKNIAKLQDTNPSAIIRDKINDVVSNCYDGVTIKKVNKIIRDLRGHFVYFKTKQGKSFAEQERESREKIVSRMISAFNISSGGDNGKN